MSNINKFLNYLALFMSGYCIGTGLAMWNWATLGVGTGCLIINIISYKWLRE